MGRWMPPPEGTRLADTRILAQRGHLDTRLLTPCDHKLVLF